MASYGPELIQTMRTVLDEVMTKIPVQQVTPGTQSSHGGGHFEGRRRGPDQLRRDLAVHAPPE